MKFALFNGQDFFEVQVNVVSATRVGIGGASANGVNRSEGEDMKNFALVWLSTVTDSVVRLSFFNTTSINRRSPKKFGGPAFLRGLECLFGKSMGPHLPLSNKIGLFSEPSISAESGTSMIAGWSVLTDRLGLIWGEWASPVTFNPWSDSAWWLGGNIVGHVY